MLCCNIQIHNIENYVQKKKISSLVGYLAFVRDTCVLLMLVTETAIISQLQDYNGLLVPTNKNMILENNHIHAFLITLTILKSLHIPLASIRIILVTINSTIHQT